MKRVRIIAGIVWAFVCLILIIVLFPGLNNFSVSASKLPFMKINPNYTGGEISHQTIEASCTLAVRKPVFDGLIKERKHGFVQVDWRGNLPDNMVDTIDYDLDNKPDFCVSINRKKPETQINPFSGKVKGIMVSTPTSYGWSVRVALLKQ